MTTAYRDQSANARRTGVGPVGTGSRGTRLLGVVVLGSLLLLAILGLVATPNEVNMGFAVRVLYVHVPSAMAAYAGITAVVVGSVMWLWRRSVFWDLVAAAGAEIALVFTGLTLVTGMLWGKITWGVYWVWDPRLTSTALLFLLLLGYVAVRGVPAERSVRNRRSAVVGLVAALDVPIVHYSVDWWRSLHQPASLAKIDAELDGLMLFTTVFGIIAFLGLALWLLMHRFRLAWLEDARSDGELDQALRDRRAEAGLQEVAQ